jgi:hypothetical protein
LACGWRIKPPDMDISCKYSEHAVADSQQVIVHHNGSWIRGYEPLNIKINML